MATISASDAEAKPGADLKAAWRLYMDTLEDIRRQLDESEQYHWDPKQIGMAYRQLMEVQAFAYNYAVGPRTAHPRIFKNTTWQTEFYSIGGNGPDFDYRLTFLDARHEYRLSGRFNDCRFLIAQRNSALPGAPGRVASRITIFAISNAMLMAISKLSSARQGIRATGSSLTRLAIING